MVDGEVCAGKSIRENLLQKKADKTNVIITKFFAECELMSLLDHPNITRFVGVCAKPLHKYPVLVMRILRSGSALRRNSFRRHVV